MYVCSNFWHAACATKWNGGIKTENKTHKNQLKMINEQQSTVYSFINFFKFYTNKMNSLRPRLILVHNLLPTCLSENYSKNIFNTVCSTLTLSLLLLEKTSFPDYWHLQIIHNNKKHLSNVCRIKTCCSQHHK